MVGALIEIVSKEAVSKTEGLLQQTKMILEMNNLNMDVLQLTKERIRQNSIKIGSKFPFSKTGKIEIHQGIPVITKYNAVYIVNDDEIHDRVSKDEIDEDDIAQQMNSTKGDSLGSNIYIVVDNDDGNDETNVVNDENAEDDMTAYVHLKSKEQESEDYWTRNVNNSWN